MARIEVAALTKTFRYKGITVEALKHVDLTVPSGKLLVLLGPSGSGKSTLLRCVAGLERANGGRITIGERSVWDAVKQVDLAPNKRDIGMIFQSYALWPHMTVRENVAYPLRVRGLRSELMGTRVDEVLSTVGCGHLADRIPSALSGGQQQRVALARALVARPSVLLFDEPLSNVDALLRRELRAQIKRLHEEVGFTGVYVTHDQSEALYLGNYVAVIRDGIIEQLGAPEALYRFPATDRVAEFLGVRNKFALRDDWNRDLLEQLERHVSWTPGESQNVQAFVRPEHVRIVGAHDEMGDANRLVLGDVTILSVSFAGEWIEYEAKRGPQVIEARSPKRATTVSSGGKALATTDIENVLLYRDGRLIHPVAPLADDLRSTTLHAAGR